MTDNMYTPITAMSVRASGWPGMTGFFPVSMSVTSRYAKMTVPAM
eukprot:CAMPEP_0179409272 /NCGR_PEP_ID=MMETSP0799-20121207/2603_1 /TAXON_ID=46947 /ORGANISM="Geminigera cryophila, Strain CCMP2564" /LENGTH=44 /DNA_ID= /DNA_START= /DNA_END= /DNA_ORIENTATION=